MRLVCFVVSVIVVVVRAVADFWVLVIDNMLMKFETVFLWYWFSSHFFCSIS